MSFKADGNNPMAFNPQVENILVLSKIPANCITSFNLTAEESAQAEKYYHLNDRVYYSWRHHLLNTWLNYYTNKITDRLNLTSGKSGKKSLPGLPFHFNVSKSSEYIAIAFGPSPIGVDIETIKDIEKFMPVADQHFHRDEKHLLSDDCSAINFFTIWTRKEALIKANGSGINDELSLLNTTEKEHILRSKKYQLTTFSDDEFVMSLAYENGEELPLKLCSYNIH